LVEAEFLYQQGLPPQATYTFKHALIQAAAYQSLLKSTRQQYHQRIAQVLEARFPETVETQPELLAHHLTEAGLTLPAIASWQRAGQRVMQRSANVEAISHLTQGLAMLETLPETSERTQHELTLHLSLGVALAMTKGPAAPEVEATYARARALCQQLGHTPQLFPVLWGLWRVYRNGGHSQTARELGEQLYTLASRLHERGLLLQAHHALWTTLFYRGELGPTRAHWEQGMALYEAQQHRAQAELYGGHDPGLCCRGIAALTLWMLGYADQALARSQEALALAQELGQPTHLAFGLNWAAAVHHYRREAPATQARAEAVMALAREHGFTQWLVAGMIRRGWALAVQGHGAEGLAQIRQGLAAHRATGVQQPRLEGVAVLAEASGRTGQAEEGVGLLVEALAVVRQTGERLWEPELYRLQGELLLTQTIPDAPQAEVCFQQALDIARCQEAKSLELRAAMSLSRLWQQQGKGKEARELLAPIYSWFTEGFDTADLQEAKALLDALA
jgi:predicted ATPase